MRGLLVSPCGYCVRSSRRSHGAVGRSAQQLVTVTGTDSCAAAAEIPNLHCAVPRGSDGMRIVMLYMLLMNAIDADKGSKQISDSFQKDSQDLKD